MAIIHITRRGWLIVNKQLLKKKCAYFKPTLSNFGFRTTSWTKRSYFGAVAKQQEGRRRNGRWQTVFPTYWNIKLTKLAKKANLPTINVTKTIWIVKVENTVGWKQLFLSVCHMLEESLPHLVPFIIKTPTICHQNL